MALFEKGTGTGPDRWYYNATLSNPATGDTPDVFARYNEQRTIPLLEDCSQYYVALSRMSITGAMNYLPVLLPPVDIAASKAAGAIVSQYGVGLRYTFYSADGVNALGHTNVVTTPVVIPTNYPSASRDDPESKFYWIDTAQQVVNGVNTAIQKCAQSTQNVPITSSYMLTITSANNTFYTNGIGASPYYIVQIAPGQYTPQQLAAAIQSAWINALPNYPQGYTGTISVSAVQNPANLAQCTFSFSANVTFGTGSTLSWGFSNSSTLLPFLNMGPAANVYAGSSTSQSPVALTDPLQPTTSSQGIVLTDVVQQGAPSSGLYCTFDKAQYRLVVHQFAKGVGSSPNTSVRYNCTVNGVPGVCSVDLLFNDKLLELMPMEVMPSTLTASSVYVYPTMSWQTSPQTTSQYPSMYPLCLQPLVADDFINAASTSTGWNPGKFNEYVYEQEYDSTSNWTVFTGLAITSNTIPAYEEAFGVNAIGPSGFNTGASTSTSNIIFDLDLTQDQIHQLQSGVAFIPSVLRWAKLKNSSLSGIDFSIALRTRSGKFVPWYMTNGGTVSVKFIFSTTPF